MLSQTLVTQGQHRSPQIGPGKSLAAICNTSRAQKASSHRSLESYRVAAVRELSLQQACSDLSQCDRLQVHILMLPLVGFEAPTNFTADIWRKFGGQGKRDPLALHSVVLLSSCGRDKLLEQPVATDFLPVYPLAPQTAAQLLQGQTQGRIRLRELRRLPHRQRFEVAQISATEVP